MVTTRNTPRSAYVHVPFCRHRCGYCNFTLVAGRDDLKPAYLEAIAKELGGEPQPVDTLYFGGGTPTQLSPGEFRELSQFVLARHPFADDYEWTVEANPADLSSDYIERLAELGVTRLSLGGQSIDEAKLRLLERDHRAGDITRVVRSAHTAGLAVALDLIFAAPGETIEGWQRDLDAAIELDVGHVSTYGLTFEKGTQFWNRQQRGELVSIDESLELAMYEMAIDRLGSAGFEHYEVSNFARPGKRSRHNQVYWSGNGYWAYGPGASWFVSPTRATNHRSTTTWLHRISRNESPIAFTETLTDEQLARERLVLGLRQLVGIDTNVFHQATGFTIDQLAKSSIDKFCRLDLLLREGERLRLTHRGLMVSDAIWPELL